MWRAKEKAKATAEAIGARCAQCLEQLPQLQEEDRAQLLRQLTPDKVTSLRRTLFHQILECTNTVKATGMTSLVERLKLASMCRLTVVVAPPSSTGPLTMQQTDSARLYGWLAMGNLTQPIADAATLLLRPGTWKTSVRPLGIAPIISDTKHAGRSSRSPLP